MNNHLNVDNLPEKHLAYLREIVAEGSVETRGLLDLELFQAGLLEPHKDSNGKLYLIPTRLAFKVIQPTTPQPSPATSDLETALAEVARLTGKLTFIDDCLDNMVFNLKQTAGLERIVYSLETLKHFIKDEKP